MPAVAVPDGIFQIYGDIPSIQIYATKVANTLAAIILYHNDYW